MSVSSDKKAEVGSSTPSAVPASMDNQDIALAILSLAEAIKSGQGGSSQLGGQIAGIEKFLMDRESQRPHENLYPPMISDVNPLGERDHPTPELKCKMFWVGYKMAKQNLRDSEIELLNRIEPGEYRVTKANSKSIPFSVTSRRDEAGRLERLSFYFPCKGPDDRGDHLSMESYLREAMGEVASVESMRAQLEQLKSQLAGYQARP